MSHQDPINPIRSTSRGDSIDDSGRLRPNRMPRSNKDFNKIVQRNDARANESDDVDEDEEVASSLSVFDLSSKKVPSKNVKAPTIFDTAAQTESPEEVVQFGEEVPKETPKMTPQTNTTKNVAKETESMAELYDDHLAELSTPKKPSNLKKGERTSSADALPSDADATDFPPKEKIKATARSSSNFSQENSDLSYVNPFAQPATIESRANATEKSAFTHTRNIKELIAQLVDAVQTVKSEGKTETVVTLRQPPILEGSEVRLTNLTTAAKNEISIDFAKLSAEAKQFLDQKLVQDPLKAALEQKGFVIHTITTTPIDNVTPTSSDAEKRFARDQQRDEQNPREGKRQG